MLRFVRSGDSAVADLDRRSAGRGVWVHPRCLSALARRPDLLTHALRGPSAVAPDVAEQVRAMLQRAIARDLLQARRLGLATATGELRASRRTQKLRRELA